jgi:hypothetical protein
LTTAGDLSACKSKQTLIQLLTVNKPEDDVEAARGVLEVEPVLPQDK